MGTPKALVDDWLTRGIDVLTAAGCSPVVVVLERHYSRRGNFCTAGRSLWRLPRTGVTASARPFGLESSRSLGASAAVVTLVDLPDVGEGGSSCPRKWGGLGNADASHVPRSARAPGRPGQGPLAGDSHGCEG